ncbi:MAG: type II secretion system minor pseudopilin GspJ [Pseudomonadota bacterium]
MSGQRGFTLVEVLIALGIFSVLSAASVGVIRIATNAQERTEAVSRELGELERFRSLMRSDLIQATSRRYREPGSIDPLAPFVGGRTAMNVIEARNSGEEILFAFVRSGWINPDWAQKRASVQHVTYLVRDNMLIRRIRPFVDATEDTPFRDQVLIDAASDISAQFYGPRGWQDDWGGAGEMDGPPAIRLQMVHPGLGELQQDFLVGDGS